MIKKYYVESYLENEIKVVHVERETDKSVWMDGKCKAKRSSYHAFHDTFATAKNWLIMKLSSDINQLHRDISHKQKKVYEKLEEIGKVEAMEEPDVPTVE